MSFAGSMGKQGQKGEIKEKQAMAERETSSGDTDDLLPCEKEMLWESKKIAEVIIEAVPT